MSVPRRERDPKRSPIKRVSEEHYLRRLMEEAPGGRVTSSDVAHISKAHKRHVNERRPSEDMGLTRGGPTISFGSRVISTPRSERTERPKKEKKTKNPSKKIRTRNRPPINIPNSDFEDMPSLNSRWNREE